MSQLGNTLIERYALESLLGKGGFGSTFLARNIALPERPYCAIKQLAPQITDPDLIATIEHQFYLEAVSLSRLGTHAQIPTPIDYFHSDAETYLVTEYIPGMSLGQLIEHQGRGFTETEIEDFLTQMLKVVAYIHSQRLIHRDIKPENIIFCPIDRRYVLVDFGAVKDIDAKSDRTTDRALGTLGYAPPEQLANRPIYAGDIYGLGMTCLYLLTGKQPAQFPTDPQTCEIVWQDNLEISDSLSEIINKMLQISLIDRYHSAQAVIDALNNRSVRATLKAYLDCKYAIVKTETRNRRSAHPSVVDWALSLLGFRP